MAPSTHGSSLPLRFEAALAICAALTMLAYKLYVAFPTVGPALIGWLVEALLFWSMWLVAAQIGNRSRGLARALFYPLLYALLICSASHAYYFASAAERRFSLFEVGISGIVYFFAHVLPASGFFALIAVLVSAHGGALLLRRSPRLDRVWPVRMKVALGLSLTAALGLILVPRAPSPIVDAVADMYEKAVTPSVLPLKGKARHAVSTLDHSKTRSDLATLASPFKKIVVLVMETMTSAKWEQESATLPKSTFAHSGRAHAHRYQRYFPNNQDSRTGMLDMLSSRFIPYDAYSEEGRDHYMFLAQRSSLPQQMQALGYETAFAVSQHEVELVVGDLPWQHTIHLDDAKLQAAQKAGHLCFIPYEFEHSCEDKVLLPEVTDFLDAHERAFLYQEFIWGHAQEYNDASGKTNTEYYSSYVDALIEHLREKGTLDETLIVLTSDHGFRDTALQRELWVYRIPLWFYATRFEARQDTRLLSHLQLKDLLHDERTLGASPVQESPFVMIYGPTGASLLAVLTRESDFLLLKLRGEEGAFVLRHEQLKADGTLVGPAEDEAAAAGYLRLFGDYRRYFGKL